MEDWAKLLFTYGPFALLVLFVFVIEHRAREVLGNKTVPRRVSVPVYVLNWLVVFGLSGSVVYIWMILNLGNEVTIRGTFEGLQAHETMSSRAANLFLRRIYDRDDKFDFEWRAITTKPLEEGTALNFYFDRGLETEASATMHQLKIRRSFYTKPVVIRYQRTGNRLVLLHDGKEEELPAVEGVVEERGWRWFDWVGTVYAQAPTSLESVLKRLESSDPIIRQDARIELQKMGQAALPAIDKILANPQSSYRQRFAAVSALNNLKKIGNSSLSGQAYRAVVKAAAGSDPTLANEAFRFFTQFSVGGFAQIAVDFQREATLQQKLRVAAPNPKDGDFTFTFSLVKMSAAKPELRLDEIEVHEDSSALSTRWVFAVLLDNGEAFRIPEKSYTDKPKPRRYRPTPADNVRTMIDAAQGKPFALRVIGYKPESVR